MGPELEQAVHELALRMRMIRAIQEDTAPDNALTEREALILHLLKERGQMTVTQIAEAWPNVSESTVSMTITKLWRKHGMVSKTIDPENQRVTIVELTDKGKAELETIINAPVVSESRCGCQREQGDYGRLCGYCQADEMNRENQCP